MNNNKQTIGHKLTEISIILSLSCGAFAGIANANEYKVAPTPKYTYALDILYMAQSNKQIPEIRNALVEIGWLGKNEGQTITKDNIINISKTLKSVKNPELLPNTSDIIYNAKSYMFSADIIDTKGANAAFNALVDAKVIGKNYHRVPNKYETQKLKLILQKFGISENIR